MNLFIGSKSKPSIIGVERCSGWYWGIQLLFVLECIILTIYAVKINQKEQYLKRAYGVNWSKKDISFTGKTLWSLLAIGFIGGWVAGALGLGGGSIYNPALLTLGVHPRVSGATGMYLVLFSTINSSFVNFLNGMINLPYGVWLGSMSMIGSILGLIFVDWYIKRSGRQSIFVWVLVFVFLLSVIATPLFGYQSLSAEKQHGADIMAFNPICDR